MGITEEEKQKGTEEIFEIIMTENFSKLMSGTKPQIQEAQRTPSSINTPQKLYIDILFLNYRKSKLKKKSWKNPEDRGKGTSHL